MQKLCRSWILVLLFIGILFSAIETKAQIPNNLSNIKSGQITDAQLMQFLQQAQSSGMTEDQLLQEFKKRGLPDSEIEALVNRIRLITGVSLEIGSEKEDMTDAKDSKSSTRKYKGGNTPFKIPAKPSRVFGSDLFSSADPFFVPNLKIATPRGYILGADDELQLDIYGNNISNQKLTVSPDGFINVKYAGPINVNGMTIEQASGVIKARLSKYYPAIGSGETKIQLSLGSIRSIQVMVVGAVKKPGSITLPSISTVFHALFASGGPLETGSFRNIELVRDNKIQSITDLYDFLMKGDQGSNLFLKDNDIIRVPYAKSQIVLDGGVNRPGIFELKGKETLQQLLEFAGGFKGNAFKGRITGTRFTDVEKSVIDIPKTEFASYLLEHGDSLYVDTVLNKYDNRVFITGAVFKPGAYALEKGMDVKSLIQKAQGLKEDAFTGVANMVRLKDDYSKSYLTLNLREVLSGNSIVILKKEDSLHVESTLDLKDSTFVIINGPVKFPGKIRYEDSLSLKGLILKAGGLLENATSLNIEVARRNLDLTFAKRGESTSTITSINIDKTLTDRGKEIFLNPYDVVNIKQDPTKVMQLTVEVKGEIAFVGNYTLENPDEKLSSIIKRAGGVLPYADIKGAKLIRKRLVSDTAFIKRLTLSNLDASNREKNSSDSSKLIEMDQLTSKTSEVSLELDKILSNPGSDDDLTLQDGDQIIIPRFVNTVVVSGEVLKPVTVQYENKKSFESYISAAGGFNKNAYKKKVFVVYPNGRSARTKSFLGFRKYPTITPGSSIFVPIEPQRQSNFDPARAGVLVSAFSAVLTATVLLLR